MLNTSLSNSINTFFGSSRSTISDLIKEMKLDKTAFQNLASKLSSSTSLNQFNTAQIVQFAPLRREAVVDLFRDSSLRIKTLFNAADTGGLVLDSMIGIYEAEIKKIEKDIQDLQIFIDNYEFIAGKDDLYNNNYVEKFDNMLNDYRYDGYNFDIPDRDQITFPANGNSFVDSTLGVLKMGSSQSIKNVIDNIESIKIINNYSHYTTTDNDFSNLFNDTLRDSWAVTIKSPAILDSALSAYSKYIQYDMTEIKGAQTAVECKLHSSIAVDTLRFTPNFGNDFQLLQIVLFNSSIGYASSANSSEQYKLLLTEPKLINDTIEISFEKSVVDKVIFIFNQSSYSRSKKQPVSTELNSKALDSFVIQRMNERRNSFSRIQDMSYWFFNRRHTINGIKQNKSSDIEYYSYRFPADLSAYAKMVQEEMFKASAYNVEDNPIFTSSPIFMDLLRNMMSFINVDNKFFDSTYFIETRNANKNSGFMNSPGFLPYKNSNAMNDPRHQFYTENIGVSTSTDVIKSMFTDEVVDSYEYTFSLKSIEFMETISKDVVKSCFVSKKIPSNGQILGIKAKAHVLDVNSISTVSSYDIDSFASYELSVSNEDYPVNESDWIPILFNDIYSVSSEVVFFDITDYSTKLRFAPQSDSIILYKDGKICSASQYRYSQANGELYLTDSTIFSSTSIFCVSYLVDRVNYNPYEIDFVKKNLYKESVKQARNNNGLGQIFQRSNAGGTVTLDYTPYINPILSKNARYDSFFGTIFPSENIVNYNPVKIKMSDGTFATNMTNYTSVARDVSFTSSSVQFIQSGKSITFNQTINSPFTVFYEYVPYNLRFRLIMRKNVPGLDIPARADAVLLKMKTSYFDPYYDKLNYVSKN